MGDRRVLIVHSEQENFSERHIRWRNYSFTFSPFGFEDIVRHTNRADNEFVVFESMIDLINDMIDREADIVWLESPEAMLIQQRRIQQKRPAKPFVINEQDRMRRIKILARWFLEKSGIDPLEEFLKRPTNFWMHMTRSQRAFYESAGVPSDKLYHFACSTAELKFIDPGLYSEIHSKRRLSSKGIALHVRDKILSAGSNVRDYETLKAAAELIDMEIHVVCNLKKTNPGGPPNLIWHDFVPVKQYISALHAAAVVVVPLLDTNLSGGENTITYSWGLGKPVVTTCVEATEDFVQHEYNALMTAPGNPVELAGAVKRVLGDKALSKRLGENGRIKDRELSEAFEKNLNEIFDRAFNSVK